MNDTAIRHFKPPAAPRSIRIQESQARRVLAAHPRLQRRRRGDVPRSSLAAEELGEDAARTARDDQRRLLAGVFLRRRGGFQTRADGSARFALRDVADRLERSDTRSDPPAVHTARLGAAARPSALDPGLAARTGRLAGPGLVHRYVDKALFLPLNTCPVYCRFCTRSYAIGPDTEDVDKVALGQVAQAVGRRVQIHRRRVPNSKTSSSPAATLISCRRKNIELIGNALLDIPHVRRMRFATKGPAIMPMKIITHAEWIDAITAIVDRGRTMGKEVVLHTHFNAPEEITWITKRRCASCSNAASSRATNRC